MTDRIGRLRETVASLGAEAALVTHPANRRYFSEFPAEDHAPDETSGVLLVSPDEAVLFTGPSNLPWAAATVRAPVVARQWERPWPEFLARQIQGVGIRGVAFEDRAMTVADYSTVLAAAPELRFIPAANAFHAVREVKDIDELALIAEAARFTDEAFLAATASLEPGITEQQLAWRIDVALREAGADGPAFETIVAAGEHGARPHHRPSNRPIRAGEPIIVDMGASNGGYCADLTRTIVLGEPPALFTARYNTVLAAQRAALAGVRAGMSGAEVDALARDALTSSGCGEQFVHWIGHGVGVLVHEGPVLGPQAEDILQPGHVITIEPGIYFDDWGGIRIEDLCVVTPDGLEVLSNAPK